MTPDGAPAVSDADLLAAIDPATVFQGLTAKDAEDVAEAVSMLLRAKVASWGTPADGPSELFTAALQRLNELSVPGAVLFGDLGDFIAASRVSTVRSAVRRTDA